MLSLSRSFIPKLLVSSSFTSTPAAKFSSISKASEKVAFLQLGRLNHVAIATNDLPKATAMYR